MTKTAHLFAPLLLLAAAACAQTPAVSPTTDPTTGFPLWYQDGATPGQRAEECLDPTSGKCILLADPGFNPSKPLVFPTNYPTEAFYFVADADKLSTPGCPAAGIAAGKLTYRAAIEGSFLKGFVQPGQQSTFARTKIVATGLCPNTTYTFAHPYGTDLVTTNASGAIVANKTGATIDVGCAAAPCDFTVPTTSRVSKGFLRSITAPAGWLGDAVTPTPVTGSPIGQNFFKVTGPAGLVATTSNFIVSGKIAGPLMHSPASLDFGGLAIGSISLPRTLTITNVYPASITISSITSTGTNHLDFAVVNDLCTGKALTQDQSCTVGVTFSPTIAALELAQLSIVHSGPFGSPRLISISGTGTAAAAAPVVSMSTGSLGFGSQRVLTVSAGQQVTVTNVGSAPLGITASIVNADPILFTAAANEFAIQLDSCSGTFVGVGGTCSVTVTFNPTVAAGSTALLQFTDNASNSPQSVTLTGTGTGGIATVSPTLNIYAFPNWYQDESGLQVQPCINPADPMCVLLPDARFNPALPLNFSATTALTSINYPSEAFYSVVDANTLSTPGCPGTGIGAGKVTYRAAIEGAFATGLAAWGQQTAFARTKIVVTGLCPNTTYAFTHPYGMDLVTTDAAGGIVANKKGATIDVGCAGAPCDFSLAAASRVFGGFLRWDPAVPPAAPAGRLGDAGAAVGTPHSIIGSPYKDPVTGTPANFFRVSDPTTGAVIAQTNLFLVSGKLATPLAAAPRPLAFGSVNTGTTSAAQTVTISNIDPAASATISGVSILAAPGGAASPNFNTGANTCAGATLAPAGTCTIAVSFTPTSAGQLFGVLVVNESGINTPVEVPLSGTGVAATLAVTTASISAPAVTSPANGAVTVTVASPAGTPAGSVSLSVDGGAATTAALTNGAATFTLTSPTVGTHTLSASYAAQGSFGASTATGSLVVNPGTTTVATTTTISAPAVTSPADGVVTVTVSSASGIPTGNVALSVDGGAPTTLALTSGVASFTILSPTAGTHTLLATYAVQGTFGSSSATGSLVVNPAVGTATTTVIKAATVNWPSNAIVTVKLNTAVVGQIVTGDVALSVDGAAAVILPLSNGSASLTLTSPLAGTHSLSATYAAQGSFAASSATGTLTVNAASTSMTMSAPTMSEPSNALVSVSVTSALGTVTGNVTLKVDGGAPMTVALTNGKATFTLISPAVGTHSLLASFAAQGGYLASSASGSLTVNSSTETLTVSSAMATVSGTSASWSVAGTTNQPGNNKIAVFLTRTGQQIGQIVPDSLGGWSLSVTGSSIVPVAGDSITVKSGFGTTVLSPLTVQ